MRPGLPTINSFTPATTSQWRCLLSLDQQRRARAKTSPPPSVPYPQSPPEMDIGASSTSASAEHPITALIARPAMETRGFIVEPLRNAAGQSQFEQFSAPLPDPDAPKASSRIELTRTLPCIKARHGLLFVMPSYTSAVVRGRRASVAFGSAGTLNGIDASTAGKSGLEYFADINYTEAVAAELSVPWPAPLSSLKDNLLAKHPLIDGITTPYLYLSPSRKGSLFALHVEDYNLYSLNLLHHGCPKHWLMISRSEQKALFRLLAPLREQLFGEAYAEDICDQWIRHLSVFVPEAELSRAGIRFYRVVQRPGDLVITGPGTYHQGWNEEANLAEAINFASPQSELQARGYRPCTSTCKPPLNANCSPDYLLSHNFAATADPAIIIDFKAMRLADAGLLSPPPPPPPPPPADAVPNQRLAASGHMAFGLYHFRFFPQELVLRFYNEYLPEAELKNNLRALKVGFVQDLPRVFANAREFSAAYPEWKVPVDQQRVTRPTPAAHPAAPTGAREADGRAATTNAAGKVVDWQQERHPATANTTDGPVDITAPDVAGLLALDTASPLYAPSMELSGEAVAVHSMEMFEALPPSSAAVLCTTRMSHTHASLPVFAAASSKARREEYPYRGRGPAWGTWMPATETTAGHYFAGNSCALDASIVAGMLTNAGRTVADTRASLASGAAMPEFQKLFLQLAATPWHTLSRDASVRAKEEIYRHIAAQRPQAERGLQHCKENFLPVEGPLGLWMQGTCGLGQFTFSGQDRVYCAGCRCSTLANCQKTGFSVSEVNIYGQQHCKETATLVQQTLIRPSSKRCRCCKARALTEFRRVVEGELPLRMTVTLAGFAMYQDSDESWGAAEATLIDPGTLKLSYYRRGDSRPHAAKYKWVGGIYKNKSHYRVYWDDGNPTGGSGIAEILKIRMYDGKTFESEHRSGTILGSIRAHGLTSRVPVPWRWGAEVLIYERVAGKAL
ncbi:MAG: hypothetical protein M1829_006856 [Trizodia sp. TS-e1964]|nr:MAG: hypothetical protein M1829_006856 [Trizodia sp. TS-e1964]